jgi:hypothetical protein
MIGFVERDQQSYCRSQPVPVDQFGGTKARWRASSSSLRHFGMGRRMPSWIGPKDIVSRSGAEFTLTNDVAISH